MAIIIILIPILVVILIINDHLKKKGKKTIPEKLAIPIGLFFVMVITAHELKMSILNTIIIAFYGMLIGALIENSFKEK